MSRFATVRTLAFGAFMFLLAADPMSAQEKPEWTWEDSQGKHRTRAELDRILEEHQAWVDSNQASGTRADLHAAKLVEAYLERADLFGADLSAAHLSGAYLSDAHLQEANLVDAHLHSAHLDFADLSDAQLTLVDLGGLDLSAANLGGAHLNGTDLNGANLSGAYLSSADLKDAVFYDANLKQVFFEPTSLPGLRGIASAENLELLTYNDNPDALVQLRKLFVDGGFRDQERRITYALKRKEAELSWEGCKSRKTGDKTRAILWSSESNLANCGSFILNRVFFDWTCQYGMSPGRPLSLGVLLWLLCSVLYFVSIHAPGKTGLYRVYAPSLQENSSVPRRPEEILPTEMKARGARRFLEFFRREWLVLRASMFFSLMSAFNIGFRDINFGRWLRLLTRQKFDMEAVGWARVVAGWQSLISVYFIALWVLTYFGRPFG